MKAKFTPEKIETLKKNEVFVFGSNLNGNHAGGAARLAVEKFGAIMGQAEGIQGQSYAIPTLDKDMNKVSIEDLIVYLGNFRSYAEEHPKTTFYLTKIGCGIAGFDVNTISYQIVRAKLPKNVILPPEFTEITGYKGFNPDMTCRDFQYKLGEKYEEKGEILACNNGFHFCTNPFDVFGYYPPSNKKGINRFCQVKGTGEMSVDTDDSKVACSKIHISAEIGLKGIIDAGIKFILDRVNWKDNKKSNTGYRSAATNTGYQSAATNTGYQSAATNTGYQSAATNTGYQSAATNTGYQSAATNTGYRSAATNTGDQSAATNTGDQSAATNTGDQSAASVEGKQSIAIVTGKDSKAKGAKDCWIVLTEREDWNGETYPIKEVKAFKVDGKIVKPDTWYMLIDGKLVECE